jgi:Winged helix DNA-binding domain
MGLDLSMNSKEIVMRRLAGQGLVGAGVSSADVYSAGVSARRFSSAVEVVRWMGCVQAQDFAMGKWGVGVRFSGATDAAVEADFDAGRILRTHVLRPTWHFVLPEDIGWMVRLTGPRVRAGALSMQRQMGIDKVVLSKSKKILIKALTDGQVLTRAELAVFFGRAKINTDDIRMGMIMMDAELEGLICSGPRRGKQFTYRLLTERGLDLSGDAALGELARRYFVSRGPATVADLAWWGGLSLGQAKRGLEVVRGSLACTVVGGQEYWFGAADFGGGASLGAAAVSGAVTSAAAVGEVALAGAATDGNAAGRSVLLLPAWDEYTVGYKDRSDFLHTDHVGKSSYGLKPVVVVNGKVVGVWRRVLGKSEVVVEVSPFEPLSAVVKRGVGAAVKRYGRFLGLTGRVFM